MYKSMKKFVKSSKPSHSLIGENLKSYLDLIESIRSDLKEDALDLPGIVVAGAQSSGKSSVLQSISNIKLPSGNQITTRVPLILRLECNNSKSQAIISTDADLSNGETIEIDAIPKKIVEYTNKLAPEDGTVLDKPIHLKVIQSKIPTMTLIDLPGITHMSLNNVMTNIHEETVNLVKKYIKNKHMIILCVVPATEDFANAEAIKLALEVDPNGERTIGVITKVDMYQYNISDKITNEVKLNLGYVAVKNKSDINKVSETKYFNDTYPLLPKEYWGFETLINKIQDLQSESINNYIPLLKNKIETQINSLQTDLQKYKIQFENESEILSYGIKNTIDIRDQFKESMKTNGKVYDLFKQYAEELENIKPYYYEKSYFEDMIKNIRNTSYVVLANFLDIDIFQRCFCDNLSVIDSTTLNLIEKVEELINKELSTIIKKVFQSFPHMITYLINTFKHLNSFNKSLCKNTILLILHSERTTFTQSKDYIPTIEDSRLSVPEYLKNLDKNSIEYNAKEILISMSVYHDIVNDRLSDIIPMVIYSIMVNGIINDVSNKIISNLNISYIDENDTIKLEREDKKSKLEKLKQHLEKLD